MNRRFWRRYRSSQDGDLRYNSTKSLVITLGDEGEYDAANQLLDEASISAGNGERLLDLTLHRASHMTRNDQGLEALGLLEAMLPKAKECADTHPSLYGRTMVEIATVLLGLGRNLEAHEMAAEAVAFTKAKFSLEDPRTLHGMTLYASNCAKLGRMDESKAIFEDILTLHTRVFGREHQQTQSTRDHMSCLGFAVPSG